MNYKLKTVRCCFDVSKDNSLISKLQSYGFKFGEDESCSGRWCVKHGFIEIQSLDELTNLIDIFGCAIIIAKDYIMLYNEFNMHCESCRKAIGLQA